MFTPAFQTTFPGAEGSQEVAVDSQGRVYLAATLENAPGGGTPRKVNVLRLSARGVLDTGWGTGGTATLPFPGDTRLSGLAIDSQDRAVIAGANSESSAAMVAIARLTTSGQPDPGFSGDGWEVTALSGASTAAPDGVAVDDSDRPLVVSTITTGGCPGAGCVVAGMVSRFTTAGALDGGYGVSGSRQVGDAGMRMGGIVALPGGAAYAAGYDDYLTWVVGRLTSDGALDNGFDGDGLASTDLGRTGLDLVSNYGVTADAQGRPILTGQYTGSTAKAAVARFTSSGAPDPTFGGTPIAGATFIGGVEGGRARSPIVCGSRILLTGSGSRPGNTGNGMFLAALGDGGALDASFAPGSTTPGVTTLSLGQYNIGMDLAQAGAGVLVSGFRRTFPPLEDFPTLARFSAACGDEPSGGGGEPTPPAPTPPATPSAPAPAAPRPTVTVASAVAFPPTKACASRRKFGIRLRVPAGAGVVEATVLVNGKRAAVRRGARLRSTVDLRNLPKGRFRVEVRLKLSDGRILKDGRRYKTCAPKPKKKR